MSRLHYCTKRIIEYSHTAYFCKMKEQINLFIKDLFEIVYYSDEYIEYSDIVEIERESLVDGLEKLKAYSDKDLPKSIIEIGYTKDDLVKFFEDVLKGSDPNNYLITLEWY